MPTEICFIPVTQDTCCWAPCKELHKGVTTKEISCSHRIEITVDFQTFYQRVFLAKQGPNQGGMDPGEGRRDEQITVLCEKHLNFFMPCCFGPRVFESLTLLVQSGLGAAGLPLLSPAAEP